MSTNASTAPAKGHPPGLYLLFTVEMSGNITYNGNRAIMTLYLVAEAAKGGLGWSKSDASLLYGYYTGFVYLTPLIGGYIADNYLGRRSSITIGGLLMMLGQFSLAAGSNVIPLFGFNFDITFFGGLFLLCVGNGFFKPNISTLVGSLYEAGDKRRESAFTIFYMGINLGALIAPIITGSFTDFRYGFFAAGCGMLLGQIIYNVFGNKFLGDAGKEPDVKKKKREADPDAPKVPLTLEEKSRMAVIFIIVSFTTFFWAGFEQAGSSLNLYTNDFINRSVGSFEIPTAWFQSFNPLLIVLLAPLFSILWIQLANKGREPSTPVKMGLGMILLGLGYLFMVGAGLERGSTLTTEVTDVAVKASLFWLCMAYLFHTLGELCISPVGLSMITKLAPVQFASLLMGVWFMSNFLANVLGGYVAAYVEVLGATQIFGAIAIFVISMGFILLAISGQLKRMMYGVR